MFLNFKKLTRRGELEICFLPLKILLEEGKEPIESSKKVTLDLP